MLQLTYKDLEDIVQEAFDRFEVLYNDIPKHGHSSDYIEDDGRQFRVFDFKDTETDTTYSFSYVWHAEWGFDFPASLFSHPHGVEIVQESIINPPKPVEPEPEPELSAEQLADKQLMEEYNRTEVVEFNPKTSSIPVGVVDDILKFLETKKFSMFDLRKKIIPVCIEYQIEQKSFWTYLQNRRGAWR